MAKTKNKPADAAESIESTEPVEAPEEAAPAVEEPAPEAPSDAPAAAPDPDPRDVRVQELERQSAVLLDQLERAVLRGAEFERSLTAANARIEDLTRPPPPPPPPEPAPSPVDDRPVWRTVALARRPATVAFALGCISYQGGEIEEDPARVEVLRTVDGFEMIDLRGPEQLEELRVDLAAEVAALVARAERIGYALVRQGARK